jgi:hypothetical protein
VGKRKHNQPDPLAAARDRQKQLELSKRVPVNEEKRAEKQTIEDAWEKLQFETSRMQDNLAKFGLSVSEIQSNLLRTLEEMSERRADLERKRLDDMTRAAEKARIEREREAELFDNKPRPSMK